MVATTSTAAPAAADESSESSESREYAQQKPIRARSAVQRLVVSLTRVASIQTQLVLLQAKLTAQRIVLFAMLYAAAGVIAVVGVVFLYIGCFKLLCLVVPDYWAYLIFAGLHVAGAIGLVMYAKHVLHEPEPSANDEPQHQEGAKK